MTAERAWYDEDRIDDTGEEWKAVCRKMRQLASGVEEGDADYWAAYSLFVQTVALDQEVYGEAINADPDLLDPMWTAFCSGWNAKASFDSYEHFAENESAAIQRATAVQRTFEAMEASLWEAQGRVAMYRTALNDLLAAVDAENELDDPRFAALWPATRQARLALGRPPPWYPSPDAAVAHPQQAQEDHS